MFFVVESPVVDVKVGQDWSRFGFMSQYSRAQVSVGGDSGKYVQSVDSGQCFQATSVDGCPVPDSCLLRGAAATGKMQPSLVCRGGSS